MVVLEALLDMRKTCVHVQHMSKMIQIRNVPDELHRKLKVRAAQYGMSLSDFLLGELEKIALRPSPEELRERMMARPDREIGMSAAEMIREIRGT